MVVARCYCMMNNTLFRLNPAPEKASLPSWHAVEASVVMDALGVDPKLGLTASEVASRRLSFGRNTEEGVGSRRITAFLVFLCIGIAVGFVFTAAVLNRVAGNNIEAVSLLIVIAVGSIVGFAYGSKRRERLTLCTTRRTR
jgi:hypothetical protein